LFLSFFIEIKAVFLQERLKNLSLFEKKWYNASQVKSGGVAPLLKVS